MKVRMLGLVAALMMATPALAAWDVDAVTQKLVADGYSRVEVKIGPTQAKVEAIKDGTKTEVIYDLATGNVLKTETQAVEAGDDTAPGVFVRNRSGDFVLVVGNQSGDGEDEADDGMDDGDDNGLSSDDSDDDEADDSGDDSSDNSGDDSDDDSGDDSNDD